mmetsp:Transcript_1892/g.3555  ORF Transcript_1892/g.3555 Transcript_1892/m.3555 type:complete len:265 (-) Transcript_1892:161-955(-)
MHPLLDCNTGPGRGAGGFQHELCESSMVQWRSGLALLPLGPSHRPKVRQRCKSRDGAIQSQRLGKKYMFRRYWRCRCLRPLLLGSMDKTADAHGVSPQRTEPSGRTVLRVVPPAGGLMVNPNIFCSHKSHTVLQSPQPRLAPLPQPPAAPRWGNVPAAAKRKCPSTHPLPQHHRRERPRPSWALLQRQETPTAPRHVALAHRESLVARACVPLHTAVECCWSRERWPAGLCTVQRLWEGRGASGTLLRMGSVGGEVVRHTVGAT